MSDILNITKSQAQILRAIAYYETETNGATQYDVCSKKVPKEIRVHNSTFNDNIQHLVENVMVLRQKGKKNTKRKTKPYTITEFGQIAWLKHNVLSENIEVIQKIFPNIKFFVIDNIVNQIQHSEINYIKNNYSKMILKIALDSFHIDSTNRIKESPQMIIDEIIELSGYFELRKTSYTRNYSIIHPSKFKKFNANFRKLSVFGKNFNKLEISIESRITFLFYYNLIQSLIESAYSLKTISGLTPKIKDLKIKHGEKIESSINIENIEELFSLASSISNKKKEIIEIINKDKEITKIIQDNLKNLNMYKDTDFQNISKMFIKN